MASCGNLGSNEALARDNEINKITLDPFIPPMGGPGPVENPAYGRPPNAVARVIGNLVPGHDELGDRAVHRRMSVLLLHGR